MTIYGRKTSQTLAQIKHLGNNTTAAIRRKAEKDKLLDTVTEEKCQIVNLDSGKGAPNWLNVLRLTI